MEIVSHSEIDKDACRLLEKHWPDVPNLGDVSEVKGGDLPAGDVLCGGFPCTDISIAGNREGLAGEASGLWFQFARLVAEDAPKWVLIENVDALLSSNRGRDLGTILGTLGKLGYGFAFRVLDAQWAGLAQRRKRLFIVGSLGDDRAAEVLLDPEGVPGAAPPSRQAGEEVAGAIAAGARKGGRGFRQDLDGHGAYVVNGRQDPSVSHEVSQPLDTDGHSVVAMRWREGKPGGGKGALLSPELSLTLATGNDQIIFQQNQRNEIREMEIAGAVTAQPGAKNQNYLLESDDDPRRMTPREWERLQGFPDDFTAIDAEGKPISDTGRYFVLGNAVPVPLARWIGERILMCS